MLCYFQSDVDKTFQRALSVQAGRGLNISVTNTSASALLRFKQWDSGGSSSSFIGRSNYERDGATECPAAVVLFPGGEREVER